MVKNILHDILVTSLLFSTDLSDNDDDNCKGQSK